MDDVEPRQSLTAHATGITRRLMRGLIDFVFPPICLVCRAPVSEPQGLCPGCWGGLQFIERPYCERLGIPFGFDLGPGALSAEAIAHPPVFARARAAVIFGGTARTLIHGLKYRDREELAGFLGRMMVRAGQDVLETADLLVPIPLHRWRLMQRKFNQSALLAQVVGRITRLPVNVFALERVRATPPQVGLSGRERHDNMRGAFRVAQSQRMAITGRRIVLIDDALTTGATITAATRALKRAGAAEVDVLTFARATLSSTISA